MSGERPVKAEDITRGERLQALREAAGFRRQTDLALSANLNPADISRVEGGKNRFTGDETLLGYSQAFGVPIAVLMRYAVGEVSLETVTANWSPKYVEAEPVTTRVVNGPAPTARRFDDPIPNRAAATILLRQKGYPDSVLDALRTMSFKGAESFTLQDFIQKAKELLELLDSIEPVLAAPPVVPNPEDDEEAAPTRAKIAEVAATLPRRNKKRAQ